MEITEIMQNKTVEPIKTKLMVAMPFDGTSNLVSDARFITEELCLALAAPSITNGWSTSFLSTFVLFVP